MNRSVPSFFVYGEPDRPLDVGFMHVETVMARRNVHLGQVAAHRHARMAQITFWTSGHGAYFIEDQRLDFLAPSVSFVPSGVVHGFSVEPSSADAIVVSIADSALMPIRDQTILALDAPLMLTHQGGDADWSRLGRLLEQIAEEYRLTRPGADRVLTALTAVALTEIARLRPEQFVSNISGNRLLASDFRRLVDQHFRDNWPVDRYVASLGTTPHLLARACEQAFGLPVKAFLNERRLLEAKRLLLFTIRPLEDIAFEIGFRDAAYFSRFFKMRAGLPPSEWRARNTSDSGA
ncbi:AraC family transcriptional activator of pobA [Rhizobium sp. SG_E_25_P2]|uniref:helix-turn-helix domain-containing protein n=1 Tax=Rhizobium sp. SG_E_25_P2 TaxID=2879942 RepID=UPI0024763054|nr:helix-turn-helix domain-containing protein [Rhizobium sp. SG_E_25_P2]MDH6266089.1 AraC family transcriptional activator of pobA [Rhizobium sp. SG_E_25_P2]